MAIPPLNKAGELPPGEHETSLPGIRKRFGRSSAQREELMHGLEDAAENLQAAGVQKIWIDGSFVTSKKEPNDVDGCWEYTERVDLGPLDPVFLAESRTLMKKEIRRGVLSGICDRGRQRPSFSEIFSSQSGRRPQRDFGGLFRVGIGGIDMIRSEKQHQAAKKQLATLRQALARKTQTKAPEVLVRAAQGQTAELAGEIEKQIKDYEQLQKTEAKELRISSLHDLRVAPIRYRIAAHMTIESFARLVHVHSRQIARYESEDYQNVSWDTLLKILERLDVKIEGRMELGHKAA